jgi:hypothetical protein
MSYDGPDPGVRQLHRLGTLSDVVYAITIWRIFALIPRPGIGEASWSSFGEYFRVEWLALVVLLIGMIFTVVYWLQSNTLSSALARTDTKHTVLSIVQVFSVLLFLYSLRMVSKLTAQSVLAPSRAWLLPTSGCGVPSPGATRPRTGASSART